MPKGNIKADILLRLDGWVNETEPPVLNLVGSESELPVETTLTGTIEVSATRFYQIMKAQKTNGKLPLLRLMVIDPDAEVKQAELKKQQEEDEKSPKLDLSKKKNDKPKKPRISNAASQEPAVKKSLDQRPHVC